MERIMTTDEKIRRAEEIYERRIASKGNRTSAKVNVSQTGKKNWIFTKKLILQFLICIIIYFIYYIIQNSNFVFSDEFIKKTKGLLEYNIDINKKYQSFIDYIKKGDDKNKETEILLENEISNNDIMLENTNTENVVQGVQELNNENTTVPKQVEKIENLSQMEKDVIDIKKSTSIVWPVKGKITSKFGERNPTTVSVPKNHTGLDIAVNTGTVFVSSIEGTVELVSSYGDYGNHIKITNNDITTLYAHCNKIYVSEGERVKQSQIIGEVGNTGNTTGPHLHFEVIKDNRFVDPELVLEIA